MIVVVSQGYKLNDVGLGARMYPKDKSKKARRDFTYKRSQNLAFMLVERSYVPTCMSLPTHSLQNPQFLSWSQHLTFMS